MFLPPTKRQFVIQDSPNLYPSVRFAPNVARLEENTANWALERNAVIKTADDAVPVCTCISRRRSPWAFYARLRNSRVPLLERRRPMNAKFGILPFVPKCNGVFKSKKLPPPPPPRQCVLRSAGLDMYTVTLHYCNSHCPKTSKLQFSSFLGRPHRSSLM